MLSDINPRFNKFTTLKAYLKSTQKQLVWSGALRHLMVLHKLIHDFGQECYPWAASEELAHFQSFRSYETSLSNFFLLSNLTSNFSIVCA